MSVERDGRWLNWFLLFLLGLLVLMPFLGTGFTTNDDAFYALHAVPRWKELLAFLHEESAGQGRFYKYLNVLFFLVPHFAHNFLFTAICNLAAICLNIVLASLLIGRLLTPRMIPVFALLFLALLQDHWGHSLTTAYPFGGQLGLAFCLFSWHLLLSWRCLGGRQRFLSGLGLFFLSLCCNELFVVFLIPGLVLCFMPYSCSDFDEPTGGRSIRAGIGLVCVVLLYVGLYFGYKLVFPGQYAGTSVDFSNFSAWWDVCKRFSISALPLTTFFKERTALSRYSSYFSMETSAMLADRLLYQLQNIGQWKMAWIAQAGLAGGLFVLLLRDSILWVSWKKLLWVAAFGLSLVFVPNALLGLSEKYRQWAQEGAYIYAYTYHSYYGVCVLLCAVAALPSLLFRNRDRIRWTVLTTTATLVAVTAFLTAYSNDSVLRTKRLAAQRWVLADALFDSPVFRNLPDDTRIAAPTLFTCFRILCPPKEYWSAYAEQRSGKHVAILDYLPGQADFGGHPLYFLGMHQAFNTSSQFLTLADVQTLGTGDSVVSSQVQLFIKSRARRVRIFCPVRPGAAPPVLQQLPMRQVACGLFVADISLDTAAEITLVTLLGREILTKEVTVSDQFPYPALR